MLYEIKNGLTTYSYSLFMYYEDVTNRSESIIEYVINKSIVLDFIQYCSVDYSK